MSNTIAAVAYVNGIDRDLMPCPWMASSVTYPALKGNSGDEVDLWTKANIPEIE